MPSIPQSLLWISLVVLWLFVLVPMLVNKRDSVRRTSDVALSTRVLNTAGSRAARLIRRVGPAAGHASDPHWRREDEHDDLDEEDYDEDSTGPVVVTAKPSHVRSVAVVTSLAEEGEPDYLDVDVVDVDSGALPVGGSANKAALQEEELPLVFASDESEPLAEAAPEVELEDTASDESEAVFEDEADLDEEPVAQFEQDVEDVTEILPYDGTQDEYEYIDDTGGLEAEADGADAPSRRERRFDSATAARVSARKYRFRKNTLMTMALLLVISAGAAFLVSPMGWWVCGAIGAVTVLYLAYLRRQTRIEQQLRRRRIQRMARSRLGVENTADRDLEVVPQRLRRPGVAVLEIDDEDPEFEHLEYVPFSYGYDLPRAAGQ